MYTYIQKICKHNIYTYIYVYTHTHIHVYVSLVRRICIYLNVYTLAGPALCKLEALQCASGFFRFTARRAAVVAAAGSNVPTGIRYIILHEIFIQ